MTKCEETRLLWFHILGLHLHILKFFDPMDFFVAIVHVSSKLGSFLGSKVNIIVTTTILLKRKLQWTYHKLASWLKMILKWSSQGLRL